MILVGCDYWRGLVDWIREQMLPGGKISAEDVDLLTVTDDPAEVLRTMQDATHRQARRPG